MHSTTTRLIIQDRYPELTIRSLKFVKLHGPKPFVS